MPTRAMIIRTAFTGLTFCASGACAQGAPKNVARQAAPITLDSVVRANDSTAAVRKFVQGFYDWYAPFVQTEPRFPGWWQILSSAPGYLDANLASGLRADSAAQRIDPVSREVIDFDPFLNSQDPCPRYEVTDVHSDGRSYRVSARPVCPNANWQYWQTLDKTTVVEVVPEGGHWKITNVFYEKGDLKSLLCLNAKADTRPDRRPAKC